MPILLPAPIPPEQIDLTSIRQEAESQAYAHGQYQIRLYGPKLLSDAEAQRAIASAETLSDAVRALADAIHAAGNPAAQLRYALDGNTLYVIVQQGSIAEVRAPEPLQPYFEPVIGVRPLTDDVLEPARLLASVHADRAGVSAEPKLVPLGDQTYALELVPDQEGPKQRTLSLAYSNPGNRYVGRYFLDTDGKLSRNNGSEYTLNWRTGLTGIDDSPAEDFDELMFSWSQVFQSGVFGVEAHYMDYAFTLNAVPVEGELEEFRLVWLYPLGSNFERRWSVRVQADHIDKTQSPTALGLPAQDESYPSAEVTAVYTHRLAWGERDVEAKAQVGVRQGLRNRTTADGTELSYSMLRPSVSVSVPYNTQWKLGADAAGQYTRDASPEQSQWVLGGLDALSAWLPGVVIGDSGLLLRTSAAFQPSPDSWWSPKLFLEYGFSEKNRTLPGEESRSYAADLGAALHLSMLRHFEFDILYAIPLLEDLPPGQDEDLRANVLFKLKAML